MSTDDNDLARLGHRLADNDRFLAFSLRRYADKHRLDDDALAERLGCRPQVLLDLKLCRKPADDADCERIATAFNVNLDALRQIVAATAL